MIVAPRHKINIPVKKILIIQLGDIGDVVWMVPALQAVKNAYPQAQLMILARHPNAEVLLGESYIERVFQINKNGKNGSSFSPIKLLTALYREKFDLVIDLRADDRGAITSFLTGAKMRAALYYPGMTWRNRLFTHLVDPPPSKERIYGAAEQSLRIIRGLGIEDVTTVPQITVNEKMVRKVRAIIAAEKIDHSEGWISINPFSRWSYKEWGMEKWRNLISFVWRQYKFPVVVLGSAEENDRAAHMIQGASSPVYSFAGKIALGETPALLKMSRLHIGVDSAAPHIAAAVGTPTITIYGPSDWRDWAPTGEKNKVVTSAMPCSPCYQKGCAGQGCSLCLEKLEVSEVENAVTEMLKR